MAFKFVYRLFKIESVEIHIVLGSAESFEFEINKNYYMILNILIYYSYLSNSEANTKYGYKDTTTIILNCCEGSYLLQRYETS